MLRDQSAFFLPRSDRDNGTSTCSPRAADDCHCRSARQRLVEIGPSTPPTGRTGLIDRDSGASDDVDGCGETCQSTADDMNMGHGLSIIRNKGAQDTSCLAGFHRHVRMTPAPTRQSCQDRAIGRCHDARRTHGNSVATLHGAARLAKMVRSPHSHDPGQRIQSYRV